MVVDLGKFRIDDVFVLGRTGAAVSPRRTFAALTATALRLVHGFAELHRGLGKRVGLGLDVFGIVRLDRSSQRGNGIFNGRPFGVGHFRAVLGDGLLRRVDQRVAMVLGFGKLLGLLVIGGVRFGFLDHLLDVG